MRILLTARGPQLFKIIAQLARELGKAHTVAVYDPLLLREFPAAGILTYASPPLIAVGRRKLSSLTRQFGRNSPEEISYLGLPIWPATDFEQMQARLVGRRLKPDWFIRCGLDTTAAADAILAHFRPEVVAVWNGNIMEAKAFAHLARRYGAEVFYLERGLLPDSLVIDPKGVNAESYLCTEAWQEIAATPPEEAELAVTRRYLNEVIRAGRSIVNQPPPRPPAAVREQLNLPPDARLVLVPAQIDWDTNIIYNSPFFKTNAEVLQATKAALSDKTDYYIVFKPHPEEPKQIDLQSLLGDRGRVTTEINLHSLLAAAELVVVRNSTVGLEAVAHGKPTVVLGKAIYSHKGFTFDLTDKEMFPTLLEQALEQGFTSQMESNAERFFCYLISDYHYFLGEAPLPGSNAKRVQTLVEAGNKVKPRYPETTLLSEDLKQAQAHMAEKWQQEIRAGETLENLRVALAGLPSGSKVLIVQAADPAPFQDFLRLLTSWQLPLQYQGIALNLKKSTIATNLFDDGRNLATTPGAALAKLLRARLGAYRAIIFASTSYLAPSRKVLWTQRLLKPQKTYLADATLGVDLYEKKTAGC